MPALSVAYMYALLHHQQRDCATSGGAPLVGTTMAVNGKVH